MVYCVVFLKYLEKVIGPVGMGRSFSQAASECWASLAINVEFSSMAAGAFIDGLSRGARTHHEKLSAKPKGPDNE